jgi:hypothetical protein
MKSKSFTIDNPKGTDHPDSLRLCIPTENGDSTGLRVATIPPDRYQTAGGYVETRPWQDMARLLASAPVLLDACQTALAFLKTHFPAEHGNPALGMAWGRLEDAIQVATGEEVES